jgi:hypothetical protein
MTMWITDVMMAPWRCGRGRIALALHGRSEDDRLARRRLEDDEGEERLINKVRISSILASCSSFCAESLLSM